jgi:hypothetical protein
MPADAIAALDIHQQQIYSIGIAWVEYQSKMKNNYIQHAYNGGTAYVDGYRVDGFDKEHGIVYDFYGCYWHGCKKCYLNEKINVHNREPMYKIYLDTKRREECLKVNYTVETIWECDAKKNKEFMNFYKNGMEGFGMEG